MTYYEELSTKIEELETELEILINDIGFDIDQAHRAERLRVIKEKQDEIEDLHYAMELPL